MSAWIIIALSLVASVIAGPRAGLAQSDDGGPSFDCGRATAPVERLICADRELSRLDGVLGNAHEAAIRAAANPDAQGKLRAEQPAWLARRASECRIRERGEELRLKERWQAAPCLADMYSARLAALGAAERAWRPHPATQGANYVHPLCVALALGRDAEETGGPLERVPLPECNAGYRHVPIWVDEYGGFFVDYKTTGFSGFRYQILGEREGPETTIIWVDYGRTSQTESAIAELHRQTPAGAATQVSARKLPIPVAGRIDFAQLKTPQILEITFFASPARFMAAIDRAASGNGAAANEIDHGLEDHKLLAILPITVDYDLQTGREALVSARVPKLNEFSETVPIESASTCLADKLQLAAGAELPKTFTARELQAIRRDFVSQCSEAPSVLASFVPVLAFFDGKAYLIGAAGKDGARGPHRARALAQGGRSYHLMGHTQLLGRAAGEEAQPAEGICDGAFLPALRVSLRPPAPAAVKLAIGGDWNPMPRPISSVANPPPLYREGMGVRYGHFRDVSILEVLEVDLDGDGTQEALITVRYRDIEAPSGSDQPFTAVILRRVVGGSVRYDELFYAPPDHEALVGHYTVETVADLDGDGAMEVLVNYREAGQSEGDGLPSVFLYRPTAEGVEVSSSLGGPC